jgi:hypothetical protein
MITSTRFSSILVIGALLLALSVPSQAQLQKEKKSEKKGYGMEFLGAELGLVVGGAVTGGLFVVTFLNAYGGTDATLPLLIGTAGAAVLTPVLSGFLIHAFGKKYNPNGKAKYAILGTYSGLLVAAGLGSVLSAVGQGNQNGVYPFLSGAGGLVTLMVPGLVGVYFYNKFPRKTDNMMSASLINKNSAGWNSGLPTFSIMPHPGIPGKLCTQISLLSVRL